MAAATPTTPPEAGKARPASSPIGLASLWRAIKRYSLLVFVFMLLAITAGALVYFFLPLPKYTGRIIYMVKSSDTTILNTSPWSQTDPANFKALQTNTILSRLLLNAAVADPNVAHQPMLIADQTIDATQFLQTNLKVDWTLGGEFMRVSLEGNEPPELLVILRAIDLAYRDEVMQKEGQRRRKMLNDTVALQKKYSDDIKTIKANMRNVLNAMNNSGSTDELARWIRERGLNAMLNQVEGEAYRLQQSERQLLIQLEQIEKDRKLPPQMRQPIPKETVDAFVENDPQMKLLRAQLDGVYGMIDGYKGKFNPDKKPPALTNLEQQKGELEAKIVQAQKQLFPGWEKKLKDEYLKGEKQFIDNINTQLERYKEYRQTVAKDMENVIKQLGEMKNQNAAVDDLRTDLMNAEDVARQINTRVVTMTTEIGAPTRVSIFEDPHVFPGIEGNRRVKYTAVTVLAFIVLGLALAQWLEIRHRRIQTVEEITSGLGLQVLGTVPAVPKGGTSARSNWPHLLTEAVNTTRTMLLSGPNSETNKTLLVTSAMSGEGKTSLTTHLAVSLAGAGRRVLLIDADMRRPAVHKVLGLQSKPGLAELLMGTSQLKDVTQGCKISNLYLVPAGSYTREAAAALSTERWQNILRECGADYDFVLVDSPPILPVADALAIAKNVDGVLISVMQDLSRYGAVQTACQRLSMVGAKVLGVVVSGVKTTGGYYYYYYYDERYSKPVETQAAAAPVVTVNPPPA